MSRALPFGPLITVASPTLLSALSVLGLDSGVTGVTGADAGNAMVYILETSSATPDGVNVLVTFDDPARRWILVQAPTFDFPGYGGAPPSVAAASAAGAALTVSRSDHTHLGAQSIAAGNVGVSVSADGANNYTISAQTINVATPAALATVVTNGAQILTTGTAAFVAAMRTGGGAAVYRLQAAISTAPDGFFVVATADDATRQWVFFGIVEQGYLNILSSEIDLTQIQTLQILPPIGYRYEQVNVPVIVLTAVDGTVTSWQTSNMGTNVTINDINTSATQLPPSSVAPGAQAQIPGGVVAVNNLDLSAHGIRYQITVGAVRGTATVLKARVRLSLGLAKF